MNRKARMFNKKASDPKNKPDWILDRLALQKGNIIADIGAGGGYFSLRFAEAVGKDGVVFAVDTNSSFLEFIKERAKEKGLDNVETVLTSEDGSSLPEIENIITNSKNNKNRYYKLYKKIKEQKREIKELTARLELVNNNINNYFNICEVFKKH